MSDLLRDVRNTKDLCVKAIFSPTQENVGEMHEAMQRLMYTHGLKILDIVDDVLTALEEEEK